MQALELTLSLKYKGRFWHRRYRSNYADPATSSLEQAGLKYLHSNKIGKVVSFLALLVVLQGVELISHGAQRPRTGRIRHPTGYCLDSSGAFILENLGIAAYLKLWIRGNSFKARIPAIFHTSEHGVPFQSIVQQPTMPVTTRSQAHQTNLNGPACPSQGKRFAPSIQTLNAEP